MSRQSHKTKGNGKAAEFVKVYRFMTEGMGLQGTLLLVYARIFGFCKETGGSFWESRRGTAEFLGIGACQDSGQRNIRFSHFAYRVFLQEYLVPYGLEVKGF